MIVRYCLFVILFFVISACSQIDEYKRPRNVIDIADAKKFALPENATKEQISHHALAVVLSDEELTYAEVAAFAQKHRERNIEDEVQHGLILKSDRVCRIYLDQIVEFRNTIKVTDQALAALPGIVSAFAGSGSTTIFTASQINAVRNGVSTGLSDLGLGATAVQNAIEQVQDIRIAMRNAILKALNNRSSTNKYTLYSFMLDLEAYHRACSLYDHIYYNANKSKRLGELFSFALLREKDQTALLK